MISNKERICMIEVKQNIPFRIKKFLAELGIIISDDKYLKIQSNGFSFDSALMDETGRIIPGVKSISIDIGANIPMRTKVTVEIDKNILSKSHEINSKEKINFSLNYLKDDQIKIYYPKNNFMKKEIYTIKHGSLLKYFDGIKIELNAQGQISECWFRTPQSGFILDMEISTNNIEFKEV